MLIGYWRAGELGIQELPGIPEDTYIAYALKINNIITLEPINVRYYDSHKEAEAALQEWLTTHVPASFNFMNYDEIYDEEYLDILSPILLCERYRLGKYPEIETTVWPIK